MYQHGAWPASAPLMFRSRSIAVPGGAATPARILTGVIPAAGVAFSIVDVSSYVSVATGVTFRSYLREIPSAALRTVQGRYYQVDSLPFASTYNRLKTDPVANAVLAVNPQHFVITVISNGPDSGVLSEGAICIGIRPTGVISS